jgi:hypothetical protein
LRCCATVSTGIAGNLTADRMPLEERSSAGLHNWNRNTAVTAISTGVQRACSTTW